MDNVAQLLSFQHNNRTIFFCSKTFSELFLEILNLNRFKYINRKFLIMAGGYLTRVSMKNDV